MSKPTTIQRPVVRKSKLKVALDSEIQKAQERIRAIDVATSVLFLAVGVLSYLFLVILLDSWVRLPDLVRQIAFGVITAGGIVYIYWAVLKPLWLKVNPYFAAKLLEQSTPESKNSLINWLDLRGQPLNPIIREAVEKRAASELQSADVEQAIPSRTPLRLGVIAAALFLGLIVFALLLPDQFNSFLKRAVLPFQHTIVPSHTRLELLKPVADPVQDDPAAAEPLDIEVAPGEPVQFAVLIHGTLPNRVILEYQPTLNEKPVQREMQAPRDEQRSSPWTLTFPSDAIPSEGLWFRMKANDGQTRQYRLVVSSRKPPSVSSVEAELTYPEYVNRSPTRQAYAPLRAMAGTKAMLWVQADQPVREGYILVMIRNPNDQRMQQHARIPLKPLPSSDPRASSRMLMLEQPIVLVKEMQPGAMYRIAFTNVDGKVGSSPEYPIEVEEDRIPRIDLLGVHDQFFIPGQPLPQIELAANDIVSVRGEAQDDVAVDRARLKLRMQNGTELGLWGGKAQELQIQQANGYPLPPVPVQFTLDLTKVSELLPPANGMETDPPASFKELKPDQILELWLEAEDQAEPKPNLGQSKVLTIKLKAPVTKDERQQKEDQAKKEEQEHQEQKEQQNPNQQNQKKDQQDQKRDSEQQKGDKGEKDDKAQADKSQPQKGDKGEKDDKAQADKSQPQKGDKGEKDDKAQADKSQPQKGDKGEKDDKAQADKSQPQKGDKGEQDDKAQADKSQPQKGDKGEKDDKAQADKSQPQKGDKGEQDDKAQADKSQPQKGDKGEKDDKAQADKSQPQKGDKGEKDDKAQADKSQPQKGDKGEKDDKAQADKSQPQKGDKGEKGDKAQADKSQPQKGDKGEQDDKAQADKSQPQKGDKGEKDDKAQADKSQPQKGDKGEKDDKAQADKSQPQKGDKGEQGDKAQADKSQPQKGDKGEQDDKAQADKSQPQKGDKGQSPTDQQTTKNDQKSDEKADQKNQGTAKGDQPDMDQLDQIVKALDQQDPSKGGNTGGGNLPEHLPIPDKADPEHAKRATDLMLDSLRDKLQRGEIDNKLEKALKDANLTPQQALDLIKKRDRLTRQSTGRTTDVRKVDTQSDLNTSLNLDARHNPPPELERAFRRFTENRASRGSGGSTPKP